MVVLSTRVSYTTQLSGSTFHSGELYNTTEWWYFHSRELYNTIELTRELSDVCNLECKGHENNIEQERTFEYFSQLWCRVWRLPDQGGDTHKRVWSCKSRNTLKFLTLVINRYLFKNGSTPSGQSRVYRVTHLRTDGVHCRESAGTGPVNFRVVPNECCLGRSPWTK